MSSHLPPAGQGWPFPYYGGPPPAYYPYPSPQGAGAIPAPQPHFWGAPRPAVPNQDWARWWNVWLAKMCVLVSAFGALFCFLDGAVTLTILTDPLFNSQGDLLEASSIGVSLLMLDIYTFIAAVFGLILAIITSKKVRLGYRVGAVLMLVLPGLIMFLSSGLVFLIPVARGILASLPVMGAGLFAWAAGTSPYSGNDRSETGIFQWGLGLQIIVPFLMAILFEALYSTAKVAGIVIIYPSFMFLAVLAMTQGYTAYALARRRWGSVFGPRAAAGWPQAAAPQAHEMGGPHGEPGARPALGPTAIAVLLVVFIAALSPAAYALTTPPQLDMIKADGRYTQGSASYAIQVVNRGGQAATGTIEVWLENATYRVMVGTLDRLDGYGVWKFSGHHHNGSITTRTRLDAVVYYNSEEQDRMALTQPPSCLIMPMLLPVALAGGVLPVVMRRLGRRPGE